MAAAPTPTIITANAGTYDLIIAKFGSTLAATNTWASGLTNRVVSWWATAVDTPGTQTNAGVAVAYAQSTGIFTFTPDEDSQAVNLHILVNQ